MLKTVKSLCITIAITMPALFASHDNFFTCNLDLHQVATELEQRANHPEATPDDILRAATRLGNLGTPYHEKAAALFKSITTHKYTTPSDIFRAGLLVSKLGDSYHVIAAELYKHCINHEMATPALIRGAEIVLSQLNSSSLTRAKK